ncbi:MAG: DUF1232 domain-containing protein [Eubacteriales bacterium]|nr:DUF1232 domain-containing protein [Eubacteriales bacterium]
MNDIQAREQLEKTKLEAEVILKDKDKLEDFLQQLEKKLKAFPAIGDKLAMVPVFVSLLRSYAKKEYTNIPVASIISIIGALIYYLSPIDIIPDFLPGVGLADDAAVVTVCLSFVKSDVDDYIQWREKNGKVIEN